MTFMKTDDQVFFKKCLSLLFCVSFLLTSLIPPSYAQMLMGRDLAPLPEPGKMVALSTAVNPPVLRGIKVYANDPLKFDFILDPGDKDRAAMVNGQMNPEIQAELKETSNRLLKYFLTTLTVPEDDIWVNLSPYEKHRIIPQSFGQTEMGRDLLGQDYLLKQITASLMFPEGESGKRFWARIYEEARKKFGTTQIPVNTFNKVWIMPDKAVVYEKMGDRQATAFVVNSRLKVMLESDYIAQKGHEADAVGAVQKAPLTDTQKLSRDIAREIIIPILEKEVNEGANFAPLRQVYNSILLALWYKDRMKGSILSSAYVNRYKIAGVNVADKAVTEKIWQQYIKAYKKGTFNMISEEKDAATNEIIPRKYFAGGFTLKNPAQLTRYVRTVSNLAVLGTLLAGLFVVQAGASAQTPPVQSPAVPAVVQTNQSSHPFIRSPLNIININFPIGASSLGAYENYGFAVNYEQGVVTVSTSQSEGGIIKTDSYKINQDGSITFSGSPEPLQFNTIEWQDALLNIIKILQEVEFISPANGPELNALVNAIEIQIPALTRVQFIQYGQDGFLVTLTDKYFQINNTFLYNGPSRISTLQTASFRVNMETNEISFYNTDQGPKNLPYEPGTPDWKENLQNLIITLHELQTLQSVDTSNLNAFAEIFKGWQDNGYFPANLLIYPSGDSYDSWNPVVQFLNSQLNEFANAFTPLDRSYYGILKASREEILLSLNPQKNTNPSDIASNQQTRLNAWKKVYGALLLKNRLKSENGQNLSIEAVADTVTSAFINGSPYYEQIQFDVSNPEGNSKRYDAVFLAPLSAQRYAIIVDTSDVNQLGKISSDLSDFISASIANSGKPNISLATQKIIIDLQKLTNSFPVALQNPAANPPGLTGHSQATNAAMNGGIDFRRNSMPLEFQNEGRTIIFNIDPAQVARINAASGLAPQVFTIDPLQSLPEFLGMSKQEAQQMAG